MVPISGFYLMAQVLDLFLTHVTIFYQSIIFFCLISTGTIRGMGSNLEVGIDC